MPVGGDLEYIDEGHASEGAGGQDGIVEELFFHEREESNFIGCGEAGRSIAGHSVDGAEQKV